jgi:hypothetical protein
MALPLVIAGVQAGVSVAQTIGGLIAKNKARREFEDAEAPNYFDSKAYQTAESSANQAYRYAQEGLPEASMRFQEDMIGRSGAASLATQGGLRSGIAGVASTAATVSDQYRKLAGMDAQQRISNRGTYFNQLNNLQGQQQIQADREYGTFLNDQAVRLSRMTGNQETMNNGIEGFGQAANLAFQSEMTDPLFGGSGGSKNKGGSGPNTKGANKKSSGGQGGFFNPINTLLGEQLMFHGIEPQ